MTDPITTEPDELAAAEAALKAAETNVGQVEDRLLDGDPSTETADLIAAEDVVREKRTLLDRVRQVQAGRAARNAEKIRLRDAAEWVATIKGFGGLTEGEIPAVFARVVAAAAEAAAIVTARNEQIRAVITAARSVGPLDGDGIHVFPGKVIIGGLGENGADDVFIEPVDVAALLSDAVELGVAQSTGAHPAHRVALVQTPAGSAPVDAGSVVSVGEAAYHSRIEAAAGKRARLLGAATKAKRTRKSGDA